MNSFAAVGGTLSGVSVSTLRMVQHGAGRRVQNKTLGAISRALDWPEDHLAGVLLSRGASRTNAASAGRDDQVASALRSIERRLGDLSDRLADVERGIAALAPSRSDPAN